MAVEAWYKSNNRLVTEVTAIDASKILVQNFMQKNNLNINYICTS